MNDELLDVCGIKKIEFEHKKKIDYWYLAKDVIIDVLEIFIKYYVKNNNCKKNSWENILGLKKNI